MVSCPTRTKNLWQYLLYIDSGNKTQSGSEEHIPGDYQSGDYYYYSDSNQILEFANFTKCCPEDQVSFWHIHFYHVSISISEGNDIKACQIRPTSQWEKTFHTFSYVASINICMLIIRKSTLPYLL